MPLNFTVFWVAVELKPVPLIVTAVPTRPLSGLKLMIETCAEVNRDMLWILLTASYAYSAALPLTSITAANRPRSS